MNSLVAQARKALKEVSVKPEVWRTIIVHEDEVKNISEGPDEHLVVIKTYGTSG